MNVEKTIKEFLKAPDYSRHPKSKPAFTTSEKGLGCIAFFLKHLRETTEKRNDIQDVEAYHKNGIFEELCHLVEHKGDSSIHSASYGNLWTLYRISGKQRLGNQIISQLDTDRNHYEVYLMMIRAYPNEWVERYWKYFGDNPLVYEQEYERWKRSIATDIAQARLITDTLRTINLLYVIEKVPKGRLSNRQSKRLNSLAKTGKLDLRIKKGLIERDMGAGALSLIDSLDESIFKASDFFFSTVLDLWKSLHLI